MKVAVDDRTQCSALAIASFQSGLMDLKGDGCLQGVAQGKQGH